MIRLETSEGGFDVALVTTTELDGAASPAFRSLTCRLLSPGRALVLDLSRLGFVDSSGLGAILSVAREAKDVGARLILAAAAPGVRGLLELTGTYRIVDVTHSTEEAIRLALSSATEDLQEVDLEAV